MSSVFRPTTPDDQEGLVEFLSRVFSTPKDAPFWESALLHWKFWDPRGDWIGPRSMIIEKEGRIVAHAALWPLTFTNAGKIERGMQMIDWASDPQSAGSGVSLLQRLLKSYDFVYSIGGTPATQAIMPKFGFRVCGNATTFARPLRPLKQALQHQSKDWRLPARLARNFLWAQSPRKVDTLGWRAAETESIPEDEPIAPWRDGKFFRFLQKCPHIPFRGFQIFDANGAKIGFFALSLVGAQARLAGAFIEDATEARWGAALQLAQKTAINSTQASEFSFRSAGGPAKAAALQAGLRPRRQEPVFVFHKAGLVPPVEFQLWDDDAAFLTGARTEFLT